MCSQDGFVQVLRKFRCLQRGWDWFGLIEVLLMVYSLLVVVLGGDQFRMSGLSCLFELCGLLRSYFVFRKINKVILWKSVLCLVLVFFLFLLLFRLVLLGMSMRIFLFGLCYLLDANLVG